MQISNKHHFGGGVYMNEMHVPMGYLVGKHTHTYTHLSVLASGTAEVSYNDTVNTYTAPCVIEILANKPHVIKAITDVVWLCAHATDCTDENKINDILIREG